jgi:hypothetical protein
MTALKIQPDPNLPLSYQVVDGKGNPVTVQVVNAGGQPLIANSTNGYLSLGINGDSLPVFLSQQNVSDLLPVLTQFARFGQIS